MTNINICGYKFEESPDQWDRIYYVDFFLKINDNYIGIQIKPLTYGSSSVPNTHKAAVRNGNRKFTNKFKGRVFVIRRKKGTDKVDEDTCELIEEEIKRLSNL